MNQQSNIPSVKRPEQPASDSTPEERERELARRLAEEEHIQEDIAVLLVHNWQRVVGGIVVVLLFAWLIKEFQSAQEAKRGKASALFSRAQASYEELYHQPAPPAESANKEEVKPTAEELEKQKTILRENLEALRKDGQHKTYDTYGRLYSAVSLMAEEKPNDALASLTDFDISAFVGDGTGSSKKEPSEALATEFAVLLTAKAKLAAGEPAQNVKPLLENLAKKGTVLNVEALLTVVHLAADKEEKAAAISLAEEVKKLHPEFIDIVDRELAASGIRSS